MAYDVEQLKKTALENIKKDGLYFMDDVIASLPCGRTTFYNHKLDKVNAIKEALYTNKTNVKTTLRDKWEKSDNATLQVALYKLCANDDEFARLTQAKIDHSGEVKLDNSDIKELIDNQNKILDQTEQMPNPQNLSNPPLNNMSNEIKGDDLDSYET